MVRFSIWCTMPGSRVPLESRNYFSTPWFDLEFTIWGSAIILQMHVIALHYLSIMFYPKWVCVKPCFIIETYKIMFWYRGDLSWHRLISKTRFLYFYLMLKFPYFSSISAHFPLILSLIPFIFWHIFFLASADF